jgi:hypothetical protein
MKYFKERFVSKFKLAKEKIQEENSQLMEESMDIDQHVALFKSDMFNNKTEEQKFLLEDEMRKKVKDQK